MIERLNVDDNAAKSFDILATSLNVLRNYFDFRIVFSMQYFAYIMQYN